MKVGIDAIGIAVPPTYLELADLARARGVAPEKYIDGLGTTRMAVALADEDTVTLSARAAQHALASAGVDPKEIGLCVVGTETAVDHSKPVASYVQGLVGLPSACRIFEAKHACYGGTAGLMTALDWIRSGSAGGKKALVICADIARYGVRTPGEPTQGAGAVALLVSESPRLVSFEAGKVGTFSANVSDFWRPLYSKDAIVDGHYSVTCYLQAVEGSFRAYREKAGLPENGRVTESFAAIAYHVPYGKMAKKAHRQLRGLEGDANPDTSFERQVAPGLTLPSQIGNIYTGSLYLSLASTLAMFPSPLDGERIGLFSYGSGCCSELFSGVVEPGAQARVRASGILELLEQRRPLTVEEYEAVMAEREELDTRPARAALGAGPAAYLGVQHHRRIYSKVA